MPCIFESFWAKSILSEEAIVSCAPWCFSVKLLLDWWGLVQKVPSANKRAWLTNPHLLVLIQQSAPYLADFTTTVKRGRFERFVTIKCVKTIENSLRVSVSSPSSEEMHFLWCCICLILFITKVHMIGYKSNILYRWEELVNTVYLLFVTSFMIYNVY